MPDFTESLTIRILGDSTQLQQELQAVTGRIADLRSQFSQFGEINRIVDQSLGRLSELARPLGGVSRAVERLLGQLRQLGRTPVTLNVAPALNSLAVLGGAVSRIAAQIRALPPVPTRLPGAVPSLFPSRVPLRRFAAGGFVDGPGGADRVPALLTAGEFVVREPAARQLGMPFLNALNQNRPPRPAARRSSSPAAIEQSTVNNFGGISIHVARPAEVNDIVRDLRFHGARLRNRRG